MPQPPKRRALCLRSGVQCQATPQLQKPSQSKEERDAVLGFGDTPSRSLLDRRYHSLSCLLVSPPLEATGRTDMGAISKGEGRFEPSPELGNGQVLGQKLLLPKAQLISRAQWRRRGLSKTHGFG